MMRTGLRSSDFADYCDLMINRTNMLRLLLPPQYDSVDNLKGVFSSASDHVYPSLKLSPSTRNQSSCLNQQFLYEKIAHGVVALFVDDSD